MGTNSAEYMRQYKKDHPERKQKEHKRYKKAHPEKVKAMKKRYKEKAHLDVLNYYSDGMMECGSCEESHIEFLEIDHIHGGGSQHKEDINVDLYRWLKTKGFPGGYQVLCSNCNTKKARLTAKENADAGTTLQRKYYRRTIRMKKDIFSHHMHDGKIQCSCCGVDDIDVLCLDYKNYSDLKVTTYGGRELYLWIRKNGYPSMFRILCSNCVQSYARYGYCPHDFSRNNLPVVSPVSLPMVIS